MRQTLIRNSNILDVRILERHCSHAALIDDDYLQSEELLLRTKFLGNAEAIQQAKLMSTTLLAHTGLLNEVVEQADADLLLIDRPPRSHCVAEPA